MKRLIFVLFLFFLNACSQNEELVMECKQDYRDKDFSLFIQVSGGKFCLLDPSGREGATCGDVSVFNSKIVKTVNLNSKSSELGRLFGMETEIYLKIDRNTGMMGAYFVSNDKNINKRNELFNCTKKVKL